MGKRDPRIDAYIARSAGFAKPILESLRATMHAAVPEVEETMKWSSPFFDYKGTLAMMAAFKEHIRFGFWKGALVTGRKGMERITSMKDLPPKKELVALIRKAAALNDQGVKAPRAMKSAPSKPAAPPDDLTAALKKNKRASAAFEGFSPGHRREYIDWITGAKAEETRKKRLDQAIEWIAEGKSRHWKYVKK
jgi:uncharacterized protein YdeI (YjbR/CyaY-like superfamily)